MLDPTKVVQIERLLARGQHTQRQIARMTGVGRPTVAAIAAKSRRCYQKLFEEEQSPPARCPGCGGLVFLPCRLCRVRAVIARRKRRQAWRRRVESPESRDESRKRVQS